jgi:hypothetical protein
MFFEIAQVVDSNNNRRVYLFLTHWRPPGSAYPCVSGRAGRTQRVPTHNRRGADLYAVRPIAKPGLSDGSSLVLQSFRLAVPLHDRRGMWLSARRRR